MPLTLWRLSIGFFLRVLGGDPTLQVHGFLGLTFWSSLGLGEKRAAAVIETAALPGETLPLSEVVTKMQSIGHSPSCLH